MGLSTALKPTTMASGRQITEVLIKTLVVHFTTTMAVGHLTSLRQVSFNLLFLGSIGQQRAFILSSIEFILTDDAEKIRPSSVLTTLLFIIFPLYLPVQLLRVTFHACRYRYHRLQRPPPGIAFYTSMIFGMHAVMPNMAETVPLRMLEISELQRETCDRRPPLWYGRVVVLLAFLV